MDIAKWRQLPEALSPSYLRSTLRRRLIDLVISKQASIPDVFFDLYGEEIADAALLRDNDEFAQRLLIPLLVERHTRGLQWIAMVLDRSPDFLKDYKPEDTVEEFRHRLRQAVASEADNDAHRAIRSIATSLGIDSESKPEDQRDPTSDDPSHSSTSGAE